MRVPMKVDYGVRALVELALHYGEGPVQTAEIADRKSTRLNSSHKPISYAVFCLKKKTQYFFCPFYFPLTL